MKSDSTKTQSPRANKLRPKEFRDFADCVSWLRKSVYLIARGRNIVSNGKPAIRWIALGTGFLAAPNRLLTASHVIDDPKTKNEFGRHNPGDHYYLFTKSEDVFQWFVVDSPKLDQDLFLYPEVDVAVMHLDDGFYNPGGVSKNEYLRMEVNFLPIGSQVGVMGYPLALLEFNDGDLSRPRDGDIFLRADLGVINTQHKTAKGWAYEFTMMFNPGNSGGPIFDTRTGKVNSLVLGFRTIPIEKDGKVVTHSTYSVGIAMATPALMDILKEHDIIK